MLKTDNSKKKKHIYSYQRDFFGDHVVYRDFIFISEEPFFEKWRKFANLFIYV